LLSPGFNHRAYEVKNRFSNFAFAWFQPAYEVKHRFQAFAFKWVNLCHYIMESVEHSLERLGTVGTPYKLNTVDP
jgi:hypothetical protein